MSYQEPFRKWMCPICKATEGVNGPFSSSWALANHVVGKMKGGIRDHQLWAKSKIPDLDLQMKRNEMAERLEWHVKEAQSYLEQEALKLVHPVDALFSKLRAIETRLHDYVKCRLQQCYGRSEEEWWANGVPLNIRKECASRREEDSIRNHAYSYTDLLDIRTIIDKRWELFGDNFSGIQKRISSKKEFLEPFNRLNEIRNMVMHAPRHPGLHDDDSAFVEEFSDIVNDFIGG